jgi:hypothetical protein
MTELPTYTSVFRLRRRLYAIYDWELPVPVGLSEAGAFVAGVVLFALVGRLAGIELTAGSAWFYVVPPAFLAYLVRQPIADHKTPVTWVVAQVRYLLEPRTVYRLADRHEPDEVTLSVQVWTEEPAAASAEVPR